MPSPTTVPRWLRGQNDGWKSATFIVIFALCALSYRLQSGGMKQHMELLKQRFDQEFDGNDDDDIEIISPSHHKLLELDRDANKPLEVTAATKEERPKIAIMSSFVPNAGVAPTPRLKDTYLPHIINKACYCYIWGYDFIFNTTYGFDDSYPKWHWLNFGTWHRVPHVESRIRDYKWILYTDTDFLIQDIMRPLEAFLNEFELYGKTNVQLFVPVDNDRQGSFLFSAFAFMIRNSQYGRDLLKYWGQFARGMCPKGNMNSTASGKYGWLDTDQPGLWYAMMRTYADYFPDRVPRNNYPSCNKTTGILNTHVPPWNDFFEHMKLTKGSTGKELAKVPDDQPYIYTSFPNALRSGMALQLNWGNMPKNIGGSFALHLKDLHLKDKSSKEIPPEISKGLLSEIEHCKKKYGCYAHYNEFGELKIGCQDKVYL